MKKVKFVSGFNARVALAACAVAGFSLIGCDKEDFTVDVPNINVTTTTPDVTISGPDTVIIETSTGSDTLIVSYPEEDAYKGAAYLVLSTTATTGEIVSDVTYTILDAAGDTLTDDNEKAYSFVATSLTLRVPTDAEYTVVAAKVGYNTNYQFVNVPTVPMNQILTVPVNIVLEAVDLDESEGTVVVDPESSSEGEPTASTASLGAYAAGTYTVPVSVPDATPYLTEEQKKALYEAIDALTEEDAITRATGDDLTVAKDLLRAKVSAYQSSPSKTGSVMINLTLKEDAADVRVIITTANSIMKITFSVWVNNKEYPVEGECTVPGESIVTAEADGVSVTHAHDHGHGSSSNSGGGVWE